MNEKDAALLRSIENITSKISDSSKTDCFIEPSDVRNIIDENDRVFLEAKRRSGKLLFRLGICNKILKTAVKDYLSQNSQSIENLGSHNRRLAESLSTETGKLINPVEGRDLDTQQLSSISMDVGTRLVIAGAGTGKTTTIIGLVKDLLKKEKASPEEILVLSFTNASVNELRERISKETGTKVGVNTFHRLGLHIIASSEGKVPKISKGDVSEFVLDCIKSKTNDENYLHDLGEYIANDFNSSISESSFSDRSDYLDYINENPLITFNGEKVKSFGEADIANFLAVNGIDYAYEESYKADTNDSEHGQYHPDFHIKGTDVYIEYFGTDRQGNVAKFMIDRNPDASEQYNKGIEWKRNLHKENGTVLIETYAYERSEGTLLEKLESELKSKGIKPGNVNTSLSKIISGDEARLKSIASSLSTSLLLIKGTGKPFGETIPEPKNRQDGKSLERYLRILKPVYDSYADHLSKNNEIDFEDMLNLAAECVKDGKYKHPYKYVIVDEYQDLSRSRYNLLKALRDNSYYRLFCVGDDWQSIYRFNGCDVSYILDFEKYWGPSEVCTIETTYRFSGELLEKSSEFVCRNKKQYPKNLRSGLPGDSKVYFIKGKDRLDASQKIAGRLDRLPEKDSVLFLGRYTFDVKKLDGSLFSWKPVVGEQYLKITYLKRPSLEIRYMTIHASKGLQADHVYSLNNGRGGYGFPATQSEPVLTTLLFGGNSQLDEERRLFYVAMTRAKKDVHIVSADGKSSQFFTEMFGDSRGCREVMYCPLCGAQLILKQGKWGQFYGCSNFPTRGCKYTRAVKK